MLTQTTVLACVFIAALTISVAATLWIKSLCVRRGIFGSDNPRLGGVAIALGAAVPLLCWTLWSPLFPGLDALGLKLLGVSATILAVIALGVYDDLKTASVLEKLVVQVLISVAVWLLGLRIDSLSTPFAPPLSLAPWLSLAITTAWIVGITNAVNLIDGIDGLAAGVSLIAVVTLFTFGLADGDRLTCVACAALAGALVGFLFFNFNPAVILMGDSGSLFLGFVLALVSIKTTSKQDTAWALVLPVLALGLPIFDTVFAVVRRLTQGRSVTSRDHGHVHHRLLRAGYSTKQAALILYGVCGILACVAWVLKATHDPTKAVLVAASGAIVFAIIRGLRLQEHLPETPGTESHTETENEAAQHTLRHYNRAIRCSSDLDELWLLVTQAADLIGASEAYLELYSSKHDSKRHQRANVSHGFETKMLERIELTGETHCYGVLTLGFPRRTRTTTYEPQEQKLWTQLVGEAIIDGLDNHVATKPQHGFVVSQLRIP